MKCLHPLMIANNAKDHRKRKEKPMMEVPCNRCINCTQRKAREWAFRLWHHNQTADTALFITLTYNNESLPINENYTYPELNKQDLIGFFKRLRDQNRYKYPEMQKMKYYATGEYGGQTGRPHYHAILFNSNQKLNDKMESLWYSSNDKKKRSLGTIDIETVNLDTISYVSGYIMKRDIYKSDDLKRKREFSIMSKGLGSEYIQKNFRYHQENLTFLTKFNGQDMAIPDHFRRKIFTDEQREQIGEETKITLQIDREKEISDRKKEGDKYPTLTMYQNATNRALTIKHKLTKDKF